MICEDDMKAENINYDILYDLAFKYKETKLWRKLSAYMPLGLRLNDGNIAYINIIGEMGEYNAVNICLKDEGYYFLEKLLKNNILANDFVKFSNILEGSFIQMVLGKIPYLNKEELERVANYKIKNNLKLKGPFTYPFFRKSIEFAQSVELKDEKDFHILSQVINALLSLNLILKDKNKKDLGIGYYYEIENIPLMTYENGSYVLKDSIPKPKNIDISYPKAQILNIDYVKKLKQIPKNITFNTKLIPIYSMDICEGKFFQPLIIAPFVDGMDLMLTLDITEGPGDYPDKIVNDFLQILIEEDTNPAVINAFDKRTYDLFKNICPILDIGLRLIDEDTQVKNFESGLNNNELSTYFDNDRISTYAYETVMESIEKIQFPEAIESSYEEILEELEFLLYYSSFPYVDFEKPLILSIKEAIKDMKNHI